MIRVTTEAGADGARTLTLWDGDTARGSARVRIEGDKLWLDALEAADGAQADMLLRAALHGGRLAGAHTAWVRGEPVDIAAFFGSGCAGEEP